jgi:hypothetical protein
MKFVVGLEPMLEKNFYSSLAADFTVLVQGFLQEADFL